MTPGSLQEVLALRADPNADPNAVRAAAGGEGATLDGSRAYRLTVQATSGTGVGSAADVVILLLDGGAEAYRVLSWRNAADGGMAPQRTARR
jgi:hypothetical protein